MDWAGGRGRGYIRRGRGTEANYYDTRAPEKSWMAWDFLRYGWTKNQSLSPEVACFGGGGGKYMYGHDDRSTASGFIGEFPSIIHSPVMRACMRTRRAIHFPYPLFSPFSLYSVALATRMHVSM